MASSPREPSVELARLLEAEKRKTAPDPQYAREFLKVWKKACDEHAGMVFMSLRIEGPAVSGELKKSAVEAVMRIVWGRVNLPYKEEALWENLDEAEGYASDLVDKLVAERWEHSCENGCL